MYYAEKFTKGFRLIWTIALLATLFSACKKDNDKPAPPQPGPIEQLVEVNNGEDFIRFTYNADSTVKKIATTLLADSGSSVEYSVSYNEDNMVEELMGDNGMTIVPVYDEGELIRAHFFMGEENIAYSAYHKFEDSVQEIIYYVRTDDDYIPMLSTRFSFDANNNPVQTVLMLAAEEPNLLRRDSHINYKYDDKPNPLYPHKDLLKLFFQSVCKYNTVQEDHFDKNLVLENRYKYTYTYALNGQPQHAAVKIGLDGQAGDNKQVNYVYGGR